MQIMSDFKRMTRVRGLAMDTARELIRDDFQSTDPRLYEICGRLRPFQGVLSAKGIDTQSAQDFLSTGFDMVRRFELRPEVDDHDEALRFLHAFLDRLESMRAFLGF